MEQRFYAARLLFATWSPEALECALHYGTRLVRKLIPPKFACGGEGRLEISLSEEAACHHAMARPSDSETERAQISLLLLERHSGSRLQELLDPGVPNPFEFHAQLLCYGSLLP